MIEAEFAIVEDAETREYCKPLTTFIEFITKSKKPRDKYSKTISDAKLHFNAIALQARDREYKLKQLRCHSHSVLL